ncbi:MAG: hypothetical protein SVK54_07110 [candidate division WOR-3 bacterium]|nr:hypothetical protein [candidate division WOR-3 bacterium]
MSDYKVKGSSISSKFDYIEENYSAEVLEEFKNVIENMIDFPVLDSQWYDFDVYDKINRTIARIYFDNDMEKLRDVGKHSAERVLSGVYSAYVRNHDFIAFLKRISMLHSRFYNKGEMDVDFSRDNKSCTIVLHSAPRYPRSDNYIAAGFYVGAAEFCGLKNVAYSITEEKDSVRFELKWEE